MTETGDNVEYKPRLGIDGHIYFIPNYPVKRIGIEVNEIKSK